MSLQKLVESRSLPLDRSASGKAFGTKASGENRNSSKYLIKDKALDRPSHTHSLREVTQTAMRFDSGKMKDPTEVMFCPFADGTFQAGSA
ncbi:hypothetical protein PTI98_009948 [Pleurotus ostreatus]|nr:hypothetical protein PTI98_009948 [Pleurotus ostreatus]